MTLEAARAEAGEFLDLDCFSLSMAQNEDGSGWALIFSCSLEDSIDPLGPYDVTTHEGRTFYGGIIDWLRTDRGVHFAITDEASTTLGLDEEFDINFNDQGTIEVVDSALRRIVAQST